MLQNLFQLGGGECRDRRPARHELLEIRNDSFHCRLLQHDFRQPDAIGIGLLARTIAPGQIAALGFVPREQRANGQRPRGPQRQLLLLLRRAALCWTAPMRPLSPVARDVQIASTMVVLTLRRHKPAETSDRKCRIGNPQLRCGRCRLMHAAAAKASLRGRSALSCRK